MKNLQIYFPIFIFCFLFLTSNLSAQDDGPVAPTHVGEHTFFQMDAGTDVQELAGMLFPGYKALDLKYFDLFHSTEKGPKMTGAKTMLIVHGGCAYVVSAKTFAFEDPSYAKGKVVKVFLLQKHQPKEFYDQLGLAPVESVKERWKEIEEEKKRG